MNPIEERELLITVKDLKDRVKELESSFSKMKTHYTKLLSGREKIKLDLELKKDSVPALFRKIIDFICKENNMKYEELFHKQNNKYVIQTRHEIHYFLFLNFNKISDAYADIKGYGCSLQEIGNITWKDHATVYNSVKVIKDLYFSDKKYKIRIAIMREKIREIIEAFLEEENKVVE